MPELLRFASAPPLQRHPRKAPARRPRQRRAQRRRRHLRDLRNREDRQDGAGEAGVWPRCSVAFVSVWLLTGVRPSALRPDCQSLRRRERALTPVETQKVRRARFQRGSNVQNVQHPVAFLRRPCPAQPHRFADHPRPVACNLHNAPCLLIPGECGQCRGGLRFRQHSAEKQQADGVLKLQPVQRRDSHRLAQCLRMGRRHLAVRVVSFQRKEEAGVGKNHRKTPLIPHCREGFHHHPRVEPCFGAALPCHRMASRPIHTLGGRGLWCMAFQPTADFHPLLRRQLFDGGFDLGERAHAREDAGTPALRKHSAAATPSAKSARLPSRQRRAQHRRASSARSTRPRRPVRRCR